MFSPALGLLMMKMVFQAEKKVPKCSKRFQIMKFQDVPRGAKMFQNVPKCSNMFQKVFFWNLLEPFGTF